MGKYSKDMEMSELREAAKLLGINSFGQSKEALADALNAAADSATTGDPLASGENPATKADPAAEQASEKADSNEKQGEATGKKLFTEDEVKEMIAAAARDAVQEATANLQAQFASQQPQVVQVMADTEKVTMLYMCECADDNVVTFGPGGSLGRITGKTGQLIIPKNQWSQFYSEFVRKMLDQRVLIVVSGLDDDEREMYGLNYQEGETLDRKAFSKMLDLGDGLLDIFPQLCAAHKEMVARRFVTAFQQGDSRAMNRNLIVALNDMTDDDLFLPIIEGLNAKDAKKKR